jgi:hypothetical protein
VGEEAFGHLNINYATIVAPPSPRSPGGVGVMFSSWDGSGISCRGPWSIHQGTEHPGNLARGLESRGL